MNKTAYLQVMNDGLAINSDVQKAIDGFSELNFDLVYYTQEKVRDISKKVRFGDDVVVGGYETMVTLLTDIGRLPQVINYPEFSGRGYQCKPNLCRFDDLLSLNDGSPLFVKPANPSDGTPQVIKSYDGQFKADTMVWVREYIEFLSEYRVFVHNQKVKNISHYTGSYRFFPYVDAIEDLIQSYTNPPVSYTLDVGINIHGMQIVEVNDFFAIGSYGLNHRDYVNMLADRFYEITSVDL